MSSALRPLITAPIQTLSDGRQSARLLLCLAFNILVISGVAVLCVSGYGFAIGLSFVVLALAPALMPLNIALFAWIDEGWRPPQLRSASTNTQASQPSKTFDEKNPSIVPETSETANTQASQPGKTLAEKTPSLAPEASETANAQASQPGETLDEKNPSLVPETSETADTQASQHSLKRLRVRFLGSAARREMTKWLNDGN
jgi:hypothetical protein